MESTTLGDMEEDDEGIEEDTIYMYEGRDYSRCSEKDKMAFDQLIASELILPASALYNSPLQLSYV